MLLGLNLYAPAQPTPVERALASLVIVASSIPVWRWLSGRDVGIPFLAFFGVIYAGYYGLPIFLLERYARTGASRLIPDSFIEEALGLSLLGGCCLIFGYYGQHHRALSRIVPRIKMQWRDYERVKLVAMCLGILGVSGYYVNRFFRVPVELDQAVHFATELSLFAISVLFAMQLKGDLGSFGKVILWTILVPTRLLLGLGTGYISQGLDVLLLLALIYAALRHRIFWSALVAALVTVVLLIPARGEFRALTWHGEAADLAPHEKAALWGSTIQDAVSGEGLSVEALQSFLWRLSHLTTFAEVVEMTPDTIPFWQGETLYPLLYKAIPRFLYPDKPTESTGQTFGHRYGFLDAGDFDTSYNLPQLIEFFVNFGAIGVAVGMFVIGIAYRTIQHIFVHPGTGLGAIVTASYLFSRLLFMESAFSLIVGGCIWGLAFLALLHGVVTVAEGPRSGRRV
jgi:hypothetical protein